MPSPEKKGRISEIGMIMIRPNTLCALLENLKVRKYGKERRTCKAVTMLFVSFSFSFPSFRPN
jgi:hypothetical protein